MSSVEKKFDIRKRQDNAFAASVENAKIANDAVKSSQNWLLVLGLAEMSFLGTLLVRGGEEYSIILKILLIILLLSFCTFIWGSVVQYKHVLGTARKHEAISQTAVGKYLNKNIFCTGKEPEDLKLPEKQIITSKTANYLIFSSYVMVTVVTIGIILLIIGL